MRRMSVVGIPGLQAGDDVKLWQLTNEVLLEGVAQANGSY